MELFDTHTHVHFGAFKDDMDETIRRAQDAGVLMVTVGTQQDTSQHAVEVANKYDGVWAAVGLHPNHTVKQEFTDPNEVAELAHVKTREEAFDMDFYRKLAMDPKCVAIGECGLDFYRIPEELDREEVIFTQVEMVRRQFELATELKKPVVIHCRDAYTEQADLIEEFIKEEKLSARGIIHCFTGTQEEADRFVALGFLISFSGIVTFPPRKGEGDMSRLARIAKSLPLDKILIETDAPYLAPSVVRGKRNEPMFVKHVAEFIAGIRGIRVEELAEVTTGSAKRVFRI